MNKLIIALIAIATSGCASTAVERATSPVDVNVPAAPRVAMAPPGTMEFVVREAPALPTEVAPPETSIRPGVCEKPRHLHAAP